MHTTIGEIDESLLTKKEFNTGSNEWNTCTATEWYFNGEMVRRDVLVDVHKLPEISHTVEI